MLIHSDAQVHTRTHAHLRNAISQMNSCGHFLTKKDGTNTEPQSVPVTNLLPKTFFFITLIFRFTYTYRITLKASLCSFFLFCFFFFFFCRTYSHVIDLLWRLSSFFCVYWSIQCHCLWPLDSILFEVGPTKLNLWSIITLFCFSVPHLRPNSQHFAQLGPITD